MDRKRGTEDTKRNSKLLNRWDTDNINNTVKRRKQSTNIAYIIEQDKPDI